MKIIFQSKLSINECIDNFKANTREPVLRIGDLPALLNDYDRVYVFNLNKANFSLERAYSHNGFSPIFSGKFVKNKSFTIIGGQLKIPMFPQIFIKIWLSLTAFVNCLLIGLIIKEFFTQGTISLDTSLPLLIPLGLFIYGIFLTKTMYHQANRWQEEMIEFIKKILDAEIQHNTLKLQLKNE